MKKHRCPCCGAPLEYVKCQYCGEPVMNALYELRFEQQKALDYARKTYGRELNENEIREIKEMVAKE